MRRSFYILILLILFSIGCGEESQFKKLIPAKPIGWVSDFEKNFTDEQVKILDSIIEKHEDETTNQIAIVTIAPDTVYIKSMPEFEQFSFELCNDWGIGQSEKNNGVGVIFSKKLKMIRIEVGKGLEANLTDEKAKFIIDSLMIPDFKNANYFEGTLKGLQEVIRAIR